MLRQRLRAQTRPKANSENMVFWADYRVTVLGARLFRVEQSAERKFRDSATQAIWFRDMEKQRFAVERGETTARIDTGACRLILTKDRGQVCVELRGKRVLANNEGNLSGTYRTLDNCNGDVHKIAWIAEDKPKKIRLGDGVCSKTGVAVLEDSRSLTLGEDGEVKNERASGTDEYIFAFGEDYLGAIRALYTLTGFPPLLPRFALGNWWSRYHAYTEKEYLRVLAGFAERKIPLTVATVDMDWHYSEEVEEWLKTQAPDTFTPEYAGAPAVNYGWTGYTWNRELFPDPALFLQKVKAMGLKVTLNLHPSDGVRFWEEAYPCMANALGRDPASKKQIPFDFTDAEFINAYFEILHRPLETQGVDFWWMDWQQPEIPWAGEATTYDPLWALNHYHYLDNAEARATPLLLSRYAGVGSHRYPVGFSGDTEITWNTLAYLPYFTATASNIGYTWWSHDIGGHMNGEKSDELYLRHVQYGVFSPINRLHCTNAPTMTKEPWAYLQGAGEIATKFLRLRHRLIPYLYTAAWRTAKEGIPLVQPLYYRWKEEGAYLAPTEYLFGSELLVLPVTEKADSNGYAKIKAWLPEGRWTDIFTGTEYAIGKGGKTLTLRRPLESIPALVKGGGILPLSKDEGNACGNPARLQISVYAGDGEYTLYEDGKEEGKGGELFTRFVAKQTKKEGVGTQTLAITAQGEGKISPKNRRLTVRFENLPLSTKLRLFVDGKQRATEEDLTDCPALQFAFEVGKSYLLQAEYACVDRLTKWKERATKVLLLAEGDNEKKRAYHKQLQECASEKEFLAKIQACPLSALTKALLKEELYAESL